MAECEFSDLRRFIGAAPVDAAIRRLAGKVAADNALGSLTVSCWPWFKTELGITPCAAYAWLTDIGLVTACEGDLEGALGMYILQSLAGTSAMTMDFTDVDRATEMIEYWHCGNLHLGFGQLGTVRLAPHFKPGSRCFPPAGQMTENTRGKGFDRTRGWLGWLRFEGRALPLQDLLATVMVVGIPPHHCLVRGDVVSALTECMACFCVEVIRPLSSMDSAGFETVRIPS